MPFIPVPNTVLAEVRMAIHGQRVENTLYFTHSAGWTTATATTLANNLITWWTVNVKPQVVAELELIEVVVSDLNVADSFQVTVPSPTPHPVGSASGEGFPNNVSLTISLRTANRGRSFRGRNYLVGIPENVGSLSQVTSAYAAAVQAAWNTIPASTASAGGVWVVASRFHNKLPRVTGVTTPITAVVIVDNFVDSQRRRLPGRGT